jgi:PT repeat./Putative peptidoglycan binding domain.
VRSPRRLLAGIIAGVLAIAAVGWVVGTRLRSPADEAASRRPPAPSLVTAPVTREKLTSTVAVSGRLEYGSPVPVTLAGAVGSGSGTGTAGAAGAAAGAGGGQRVTRAPRVGRLAEGDVLMEVDGRPVFALEGTVPMHRTITPGAKGADVRQLQRALRRLGYRVRASGEFDRTTADAVRRWYAKKGYRAQEPGLTERQTLADLRRAVRTAEETLAADRKAAKEARDLTVLKARLANARADLRVAKRDLAEAEARTISAEDAVRLQELERNVAAAQEDLEAARRALAKAGGAGGGTASVGYLAAQATTQPTTQPTAQPSSQPSAQPSPQPSPSADLEGLRSAVVAAERNLASAEAALAAFQEQATAAHAKRVEELRKAVRTAKEAVLTAEQALRQARDPGALDLKVRNSEKNLASAREILAEYERSYGLSIPPGEIVFLPDLPARLDKVEVKAGETVQGRVAVVTSSTFMVTGSVDSREARLLRVGMPATVEFDEERSYPATLTALGEAARTVTDAAKDAGGAGRDSGEDQAPDLGSEPVLLQMKSRKGLRSFVGAAVTARISVGATEDEVLTVPVAAVVTSADGKPRVQVEYAPDRTRDVEVRTGLTADGKVQVTPVTPGELKEGDRVVIGNA